MPVGVTADEGGFVDTFKADLEILGKLGSTLQELARDADAVKPNRDHDASKHSPLLSATAADLIERELFLETLMPTVKERLTETGDVMASVARQYKDSDGSNADMILDLYRKSTGDWTA